MKIFQITPEFITKTLLKTVTVLLILNLSALYVKFGLGYGRAFGFVPMFNFDNEKNVPTLYSALAICLCSLILWMIANLKYERAKKLSVYWQMLYLIFLFLAFDEFFVVHEEFSLLVRPYLKGGGTGFLYYQWVIPYLVIFGTITIFFLRFFFSLPGKTRIRFIVAGIVFLSGAVGMEMISGKYHYETGSDISVGMALITTLEELLEMVGIILFISALAKYYLLTHETGTFEAVFKIKEEKRLKTETIRSSNGEKSTSKDQMS